MVMGPLRVLAALFDVDTAKAQEHLQSLNEGIASSKEMLKGLVEAGLTFVQFHAAKELVGEMIELGSATNTTANRLGVAVGELEAFQFAANMAGVGSQEAAAALGNLSKNMGEALDGTQAQVEMFQALHVALKDADGNVRTLGDVLPEVADAFVGMSSDQERSAKAMQLFGKQGAALVPLLRDGSKGLAEVREEFERLGGGMGEDFAKDANATGDEIDKMRFAWKMWKTQIAGEVLPVVKWLAQRFQSLTGNLRKITRETNLAKEVWAAFGISATLATGKAVGTWAKLMKIVPRDAGFWKTALGLGQWALVAGAAVLFGLVLEDIYTAMNGGESITKDWLTSFLGAEEATNILKDMREATGAIGEALKEMAPIAIGVFSFLAKLIATSVEGLAGLLAGLLATVKAVNSIRKGSNEDWDNLGNTWMRAMTRTSEGIHHIWDDPKQAGNKGGMPEALLANPKQAGADSVVLPPGSAYGPPPPPNVTQNIDVGGIKVVGGPTNADTGRAVSQGVQDGLQAQLQQAKAAAGT